MSVKTLNPYLTFDGTAEKALELYAKALGAKAEHVMRWKDGPPGMEVPPAARERIMHAELAIDGQRFMLADAPPGMAPPPSSLSVCLGFDDNEDMRRRFDALGGRVLMPIEDAFWGATFGQRTDPFGVTWMFVGPKR